MASDESKSTCAVVSPATALDAGGIKRNPTRTDQAKAIVKRLVAVKSVDELVAQGEASQMHRTLGAFDLTLLGVGEIVGKSTGPGIRSYVVWQLLSRILHTHLSMLLSFCPTQVLVSLCLLVPQLLTMQDLL